MLRHEAQTTAEPEAAWSLIAEPGRWQEWAPHLRGAWGLGSPTVQGSALGAARLLGVVPVPARIVRVERSAQRSHWTWRVGLVEFDHEVIPLAGGGATVAITCRAPRPLEPLIAATYWPLVGVLVRRLARIAAATA